MAFFLWYISVRKCLQAIRFILPKDAAMKVCQHVESLLIKNKYDLWYVLFLLYCRFWLSGITSTMPLVVRVLMLSGTSLSRVLWHWWATTLNASRGREMWVSQEPSQFEFVFVETLCQKSTLENVQWNWYWNKSITSCPSSYLTPKCFIFFICPSHHRSYTLNCLSHRWLLQRKLVLLTEALTRCVMNMWSWCVIVSSKLTRSLRRLAQVRGVSTAEKTMRNFQTIYSDSNNPGLHRVKRKSQSSGNVFRCSQYI